MSTLEHGLRVSKLALVVNGLLAALKIGVGILGRSGLGNTERHVTVVMERGNSDLRTALRRRWYGE